LEAKERIEIESKVLSTLAAISDQTLFFVPETSQTGGKVVRPVLTAGGLREGWPRKEGVSEATGTEESEHMSSGVPGKCQVLSSEETWRLL